MNKQILSIIAAVFFLPLFAQEDMKVIWETKLDHEILYDGTGTEDRNYSYAASDKEMTVFANATGRVKWTGKFKDIAPGLKKIDELIPFWESNTIFLFDRKMGKDMIACVDMGSGKTLWTTDKYQNVTEDNVVYIPEKEGFAISLKDALVFVKVATGEETWSTSKFTGSVGNYVYQPDGSIVMINYKPTALAALFSGFKNQLVRIDTKNGDILWEATYVGLVQKKVISREPLVDIVVEGDKVILRLNGIQVYDYNTGANLWTAAFNFAPDIGVKAPGGTVPGKFGIYQAVGDPVLDEDGYLYVLDMSNKKNQYVKKYDVETGQLIWTSGEIKDARAIPNMVVHDGVVALQIGGAVEAQARIKYVVNAGSYSYTYYSNKIWFPEVKPMGVQAFDASTGKMLWDSERFKKGITNSIYVDGNFIVCSGKSLYSLDMKAGNDNYEVPVSKGGVGNAALILPFKDMIVVIGDKGVSTFKASNGDLVNSGAYKSSLLDDVIGDVLVMKTDGADIAAYDLNTCKYKEFKAKKGATTSLSLDGKYVYVYEKKDVTKLSTE